MGERSYENISRETLTKQSFVCFTAVFQYRSATSKISYTWLKKPILNIVSEENNDMLVCPMFLSISVDRN